MCQEICFKDTLPIISAIIGAVTGIILGAWINRKSAYRAAFAQQYIIAANRFVRSWWPVREKIKEEINKKIISIQDAYYVCAYRLAHDVMIGKVPLDDKKTIFGTDIYLATISFKWYVPRKRIKAFEKACFDLFGTYHEDGNYNHLQYSNIDAFHVNDEWQKTNEIEAKKELLKRINTLLKFAEKDKP